MLVIGEDGVRSYMPFPPVPAAHCVFEHVYFARPDSYVFGQSVNAVRTNLGRLLAEESAVDADVVVPIPDSGVVAAIGYAERSGIPLKMGLIRNHFVGRTFIQPQQSVRELKVKVKLNTVRSVLDGKRVVLVDDSIVRGTTSQKIVSMIKAAGAREVHMRISCPPTVAPCYYGIDTPHRDELIAARHSVDEIRSFMGADTLAYLSHRRACARRWARRQDQYCNACYTKSYPIDPPRDTEAYRQMVLKIAGRRGPDAERAVTGNETVRTGEDASATTPHPAPTRRGGCRASWLVCWPGAGSGLGQAPPIWRSDRPSSATSTTRSGWMRPGACAGLDRGAWRRCSVRWLPPSRTRTAMSSSGPLVLLSGFGGPRARERRSLRRSKRTQRPGAGRGVRAISSTTPTRRLAAAARRARPRDLRVRSAGADSRAGRP